ncbi:MAG TPA: hypothetical protein VLN49_21790, partial [Gemmatimonadaceae bacterium]|nr:hypothetical protein [Gemmatimonadaceae bacterium]
MPDREAQVPAHSRAPPTAGSSELALVCHERRAASYHAHEMVEGTHARALGRLAEARTASDVIALALDETPAISFADAVGVYLFQGGSLDVHSRGASERAVSRYLALPAGSDP